MNTALRFSRLHADAGGVSHFDEIGIEVVPRDFAPPAAPFSVSAFEPASRCGFLYLPAGWVGEMHPSPLRMWIFVLAGEMEFEAGDGEKRVISPGSALLLEDTTGLGHVSRVLGHDAAALAAVHMS
ncbi:cupin domain-containing protein [Herbaspirillum sp. HC18]|nr:cupin domain-containing protein [Herbaspirillum sp. HC18]